MEHSTVWQQTVTNNVLSRALTSICMCVLPLYFPVALSQDDFKALQRAMAQRLSKVIDKALMNHRWEVNRAKM